MDDPSTVVTAVLRQWGAKVVPVPTGRVEAPDYIATLDGCRYLIEEKEKHESEMRVAERERALEAGEVHVASTPIRADNTMAGIARKASKQLSSASDAIDHDYKILWLTAIGRRADVDHKSFIATLYGTTRIYERDRVGLKECYFFRESAFFANRHALDGAVVGLARDNSVTLFLCLNPYSVRWEGLRDSPLAKHISNGIIDPSAEERAGEAYVADTDIDRRNERAVLDFVQAKYGLKELMNMDMGLTTATISVPRQPL